MFEKHQQWILWNFAKRRPFNSRPLLLQTHNHRHSWLHCTWTRFSRQKIKWWRLSSFITLSTRSCLPFPLIVRTAAARFSHSHFVRFLFHGAYVTSSLCDQTTFPYFGCLTLQPTSWEPQTDKSFWQRLRNIFSKYYVMTQVNVVTQFRTSRR